MRALRASEHGDAATKPYAAIWEGATLDLTGQHGVLSVHRTPELAIAAVTASKNSCRWIWGAYKPWFRWRVIDRRSGEVIHKIY